MANPAFDSADYGLLWPRELFIRELNAISAIIHQHNHPNIWIECLLEEVFLGDAPVQDYKSSGTLKGCYYVDALLAYAPQLREHHEPRPYWSARHGVTTGGPRRNPDQLRGDFARLISSLQANGYFERALLRYCADHSGIASDIEALFAERLGLGVPGLDRLVVPGHHRTHQPDPRPPARGHRPIITDSELPTCRHIDTAPCACGSPVGSAQPQSASAYRSRGDPDDPHIGQRQSGTSRHHRSRVIVVDYFTAPDVDL